MLFEAFYFSFAGGSKHINSTDIMVSVKLLPLAAVVFLALLALLLLGACGGEATIPETATPPTIPAANTDTTEPRLTPDSALAPTIVPTATLMRSRLPRRLRCRQNRQRRHLSSYWRTIRPESSESA